MPYDTLGEVSQKMMKEQVSWLGSWLMDSSRGSFKGDRVEGAQLSRRGHAGGEGVCGKFYSGHWRR